MSKILPATHDDVQLWHVTYDDGDEEDLDSKEMDQARKLYVDGRVGNDDGVDDPSDGSSDDEYHPIE